MKTSTRLAPYVVLLLFFCGLVVWLLRPTSGALTAKRVEQDILALPAGSTKAQVASLVHKEGLDDSSAYVVIDKHFLGDSAVTNSGYKSSALGGYYGIRVPHTSRSIIGECFTMYYFFFDKKGKLLKNTSESGCIGL